jgi:dTDP-4-dehydrorhamnose reductase
VRVLILGGGGMLGHKLAQGLSATLDTWATIRGSGAAYARYGILPEDRLITGVDVLNLDSIVETMARVRPDAVVNCIGIIKQLATAHDPVLSLSVNSLLPHRLQRLCVAAGARLIHISTDCVFRGDKGMYTEDDPSDALDLYGRTKFLGETSGPGALTIRTSIIGREIATRSGLVEWFLAQRGGRIEGYRHAIFSGFTTQEITRIVRRVLTEFPDLHGTLQASSEPISKYDLLLLLKRAYGVDVEIEPSDRFRLDRSLDSSRFRQRTSFVPPAWPAMVQELAGDPTPYDQWHRSV